MAYRADIEIAVRGAQELKRLQNDIRIASDAVDSLNSSFAGVANIIPRSINNLNKVVAEAAASFNKVALGTEEAVEAARVYVNATNELNSGLRERLRLIRNIEAAETATKRTIVPTGNAGYGQQAPALPPEMVRTYKVNKSWTTFFNEAAQLGEDLVTTEAAKALNIKQSWNTFFAEAAQLGQDLVTTEAAKTLNIKQSWNTFFAEAAQLGQDLVTTEAAKTLNIKQSWTKALDELERIALDIQAQAANASSRARLRQAETVAAYQAGKPKETFGYGGTLPALRPAGYTNQDVRIKNLVDDQNKAIKISADLEYKLKKIQNDADLAAIQRELKAELDAIELAAAKRKKEGDAWWASQEQRLKAQAGGTSGTSGASGKLSGAFSSALIGGGFPLLFGQGTTAAAGGAVGGFAGGLLGGGFGFALSIIGTAIGDAIDKSEKFNQALAALNLEVSNTGSKAKITAEDVKNLAKNLGIAEEEAIKVLSTFAGFNNASTTKALAAVFGTDAATFQSLAAVKDKADLAKVILDTYQKIGLQTATELINQLKIKDATTVEIAFLKVKLDAERKITEEKLKQVGFMDYINSALANSRNLMATSRGIPTGPIKPLTPQDIANQRAAAYRRGLPPADQVIKDVEKALTSLRSASTAVSGFSPDKASKKAADEAAKEAERVKEVVRERSASAQYIQIQSNLQDKIAAAEKARDPILAARLQGEQKISDIQYDYAKQLANEKNAVAQEAITFEGLARIAATRKDTEREINKLYAERQQKVTDMVNSLQLELDLKRATTEEERNQIQLRYDMARLREQGYSDTQISQIQALRKQITAPETAGQTINKRIGALQDELKKLTSIGQMAITIADGIGNAFGQAFQGLVTGSMTAQQALASFFKSVGEMFISMAAEIIAKQMVMLVLQTLLKALGIGGSGGGFGAGGNAFNPAGAVSAGTGGIPSLGASFGFATGGFVTGPTNAVVGEGGQPEYIIPASKMSAAMSRYSAGARGSAVIPAGDGNAAMSANTSTALAPGAIDVRYTVERINSVDYVTNDQFQQGITQAAKQGAQQGEQRTLRRLQMSNSTRKKVGI